MRPDLNMLEALADKHELLLSDYLINFANDVWAIAYKQGMQDIELDYMKPQSERIEK